MSKVLEWISQKTGSNQSPTNPFQDMVMEASKTFDPVQIQNCANQYNSYYLNLEKNVLIEQPIKKECIIMLSFMIPLYERMVSNNENCESLFNCINSASIFIPPRPDYADLYYRMLITLINYQKSNDHLSKSTGMLKNMLNNHGFVNYITKDEILANLFAKVPQNPIIFHFMRDAINESSISSAKNYQITISTILNLIDDSIPESLYFISAFYKKIGKCGQLENIFDSINMKIVELKNLFFYEDVVKVQTNAPSLQLSKFSSLCAISNQPLIKQILTFINKHIEYHESLLSLIPKLKDFTMQEQEIFLNLVHITNSPSFQKQIYDHIIPPWIFLFNCSVLANYVKKYFHSDTSESYLIRLIIEQKQDEICAAFEALNNFQELVIALISKIEDFENVELFFNKFVILISKGEEKHPVIFKSLQFFCLHFPPITYKQLLIFYLNELNQVDAFPQFLVSILQQSNELRNEMLCVEFIEWLIKRQYLDCLAALAIDGPHKIIDLNISTFFDDFLKDLKEEQLQKMAYGLLQNNDNIESGSILIPSILPKLSHPVFSTLFDRFVAGKYLIDNKFVSVDSSILPEIGVQYLSEDIANSSLSNPSLLRQLTNPLFPHQNVIQFQYNRKDSYIIVAQIEISFSFRVEPIQNEFELFSICDNSFIYNKNEQLCCSNNSVHLKPHQWHDISIFVLENEILDVHVNEKRCFYIQLKQSKANKQKLVIGSLINPPGSTFYIKHSLITNDNKRDRLSYQSGLGLLNIEYKGIGFHAPLINAIPKLLQRLLDEKNMKDFEDVFVSLLNIESFDCVSVSVDDFLGFLRVLLCEKSEMISKKIIEKCFNFITLQKDSIHTIEIDWLKFKHLFIDYTLWKKCYNQLSTVVLPYIIEYFKKTEKINPAIIETTSLLHFLIDLVIFCDIKDEKLEQAIFSICKTQVNYGSLIIHIFNNKEKSFINKLLINMPNLLISIPFQLLPQLPNELALRYLVQISLVCCHNDQSFNQEQIDKTIPFLTNFVLEKELWISLFIFMTKIKYDEITSYSHSIISRESILHTIFTLIPDLFKQIQQNKHQNQENKHPVHENDEQENLLLDIIQTLYSIIDMNNVKLTNYMNDLQIMLYFGVISSKKYPLPVSFKVFEQCRMPNEDENQNENDRELFNLIENIPFQPPSPNDFLLSPELWFGLAPKPFIDACEEEVPNFIRKTRVRKRKIVKQSDENNIDDNQEIEKEYEYEYSEYDDDFDEDNYFDSEADVA